MSKVKTHVMFQKVMMPLGDYGFSPCYGWVVDRFGMSWQLNLPETV